GFGSGAEVACRIAFALPEFFGGVVVIGGEAPLPALAYLRHRLKDRLSVALLTGERDSARRRTEKFLTPLYKDLRLRARLWLRPGSGHALPSAETATGVYRWLEDDVKRRRKDTATWGALAATPGEPASRVQLGRSAVELAGKVLRQDRRQYEGARLLEWVLARCGSTASATKAKEMLEDIDNHPDRSWALAEQKGADQRALLLARARAEEQSGDLEEARAWWRLLAKAQPPGAEGKKAPAEIRRLTALLARTPYAGATFAGETTTVRSVVASGPAARAGVRAGDRIDELG